MESRHVIRTVYKENLMSALPQPLPAMPPETTGDTRTRWLELALILFVSCATPILASLYYYLHGPTPTTQFAGFRWTSGLLHEIYSLCLLAYVLSRRRLSFAGIGFRWSFKDFLLGVPLVFASHFAYVAAFWVAYYIHFAAFGSAPTIANPRTLFPSPNFVAALYILVTPFFEELIVRAYLMTEVMELTGSATLAVGVSTLLQASYHLYYGWVGAICLFFSFLVFSLFFAAKRRALPVVSAHGLMDIYASMHW